MVQLLCRAFFTRRLRVRRVDRRRSRHGCCTGLAQRRNLLDCRTHPRVLGTLQQGVRLDQRTRRCIGPVQERSPVPLENGHRVVGDNCLGDSSENGLGNRPHLHRSWLVLQHQGHCACADCSVNARDRLNCHQAFDWLPQLDWQQWHAEAQWFVEGRPFFVADFVGSDSVGRTV